VLHFGAEDGAVQEARGLDCLAGVWGRAAWEVEEGGVGGGAVEAVYQGEGEGVDGGVGADCAEGGEA
jgi:hypothetical protein